MSNIDPVGLWTGQIGGSLNVKIGPITISIGGGMAFDGHGNFAGYTEKGGGSSFGGDASGGISIKGSNGDTINDLNGPFVNGSAGGGLGPHASADAFAGTGEKGQIAIGGGVTLGIGAGAGSAVTITNTTVGNQIGG